MRAAWRVADVRAAEAGADGDACPPGTLMQRAAAGLARRCALLLAERYGGVYGARVLLLVGAGDNGGDALYAGAPAGPAGARAVDGAAARPGPGPRRRAWPRCAPPAAGSSTGLPGPRSTWCVDGIVGIGGHRRAARARRRGWSAACPGCAAATAAAAGGGGRRAQRGRRSTPATCRRRRRSRADVTVTFGCLKPAPGGRAGRAAGRPGRPGRHRARPVAARPTRRCGCPTLADVARLVAAARAGVGQVHPGRGRAWPPARPTYPGAALLSVGRGAGRAGRAWSATPGGAAPTWCRAAPVGDRRRPGRPTPAGCRPGCAAAGWAPTSAAAAELRAVLGRPGAGGARRRRAHPAGRRLAWPSWLRRRDAPTVVTPHDREFARLAGDDAGRRTGSARRCGWPPG